MSEIELSRPGFIEDGPDNGYIELAAFGDFGFYVDFIEISKVPADVEVPAENGCLRIEPVSFYWRVENERTGL